MHLPVILFISWFILRELFGFFSFAFYAEESSADKHQGQIWVCNFDLFFFLFKKKIFWKYLECKLFNPEVSSKINETIRTKYVNLFHFIFDP